MIIYKLKLTPLNNMGFNLQIAVLMIRVFKILYTELSIANILPIISEKFGISSLRRIC